MLAIHYQFTWPAFIISSILMIYFAVTFYRSGLDELININFLILLFLMGSFFAGNEISLLVAIDFAILLFVTRLIILKEVFKYKSVLFFTMSYLAVLQVLHSFISLAEIIFTAEQVLISAFVFLLLPFFHICFDEKKDGKKFFSQKLHFLWIFGIIFILHAAFIKNEFFHLKEKIFILLLLGLGALGFWFIEYFKRGLRPCYSKYVYFLPFFCALSIILDSSMKHFPLIAAGIFFPIHYCIEEKKLYRNSNVVIIYEVLFILSISFFLLLLAREGFDKQSLPWNYAVFLLIILTLKISHDFSFNKFYDSMVGIDE